MADATVLIYHMSEERMRMLKALCVSMGIRAAAVDRGMERAPVGLLSGLVNPVKLTQGASGRMKEIRGLLQAELKRERELYRSMMKGR